MKRGLIVIIVAVLGFVALALLKVDWVSADRSSELWQAFIITSAGFLTLMIYSFLYADTAFYKFAEHLYVGMSAAYWMCVGFWSNIVQQAVPRLSQSLSEFFGVPFDSYQFHYYIPIILGLLLMTRLMPESLKIGWLSKWTLAFIVAATAGLVLPAYLQTNFIAQISSTMELSLAPDWQGWGVFFSEFDLSISGRFIRTFSNWVTVVGVVSGLVYFFFSKEHTGIFGKVSRLGIWVLMLTFGAAFGYTVMGRISLLVGRLTFLFDDWMGIIS